MLKAKKGAEVWVSYILLILITVSIAALIFSWIRTNSTQNISQVEKKVNTEKCDRISFSVADSFLAAPNATAQTLYIKLTNNGYLRIDRVILRKYFQDAEPDVQELSAFMRPDDSKEIRSPYENTIRSYEIIPVYNDAGTKVICTNQKVSMTYDRASQRFT